MRKVMSYTFKVGDRVRVNDYPVSLPYRGECGVIKGRDGVDPSAWEVEFENGNRNGYFPNHLRRIKR